MAATPLPDGHFDLIIVGGGPAGCAAALMAASVGMRSVLVEAEDALCGKLQHIAAVNNVVGGHTSGPELAAAITKDLARTDLCQVQLGVRATKVDASDEHAAVTLDTGRRLTAAYAVVATGVGPLSAADVSWLTVAEDAVLPTLWGAKIPDSGPGPLLVLGADRPLGTFLRAHPAHSFAVVVAYPPSDEYKVDEVRNDPRVTLLPVTSLSVRPTPGAAFTAEWADRQGQSGNQTAHAVYLNLGSAPAPPPGAVTPDSTTGYCPSEAQHPRILTAGDLRSSRFQRIMTATGSGSEAALRAYYAQQNLPLAERGRAAY